MLIGHPMDSSGFAAIAQLFAVDHTVVAYDPRGFGRSTIQDRHQDAEPDLIAEDVSSVLNAAGNGPAQVFGSSGGAVTSLALAARHPDLVRTVVAHEPPLALVLPDVVAAERDVREVYETYRTSGIGPAWQRFFAFTGMPMPPQGEVDMSDAEAQARALATSERFFGQSLLPVVLYQPEYAALKKPPLRVVIAAGTTSRGQYPHRTAAALAERLSTPLVEFPGGHTGFITDPEEFATRLRRTLAGSQT
jgi:pimeloyl-ACP methyl ester carboxylesterase